MYDFERRTRDRYETRSTLRRVEDYLRSRTAEHWAFFAAGFLVAAILT